ncbi:hypothetical protein Droror1_Dr00003305 [Drosera rotundifolia]
MLLMCDNFCLLFFVHHCSILNRISPSKNVSLNFPKLAVQARYNVRVSLPPKLSSESPINQLSNLARSDSKRSHRGEDFIFSAFISGNQSISHFFSDLSNLNLNVDSSSHRIVSSIRIWW